MDFRILGPLEVWHEGQPLPVAGATQRALLAILLLHRGEVVSADRLMDDLWPDSPPASGTTALRVRVSQLRKALGGGGDLLVTRPPGYTLMATGDQVDLARFETLFAAGERALAAGDNAGAVAHLEEALGLWRGMPLADLAYAPFSSSPPGSRRHAAYRCDWPAWRPPPAVVGTRAGCSRAPPWRCSVPPACSARPCSSRPVPRACSPRRRTPRPWSSACRTAG